MDGQADEQRLLLVDGHSMAFRAFFALRADSFRTPQGQYTNAVHGFTNTLLRMIKNYAPTHIAVAFDLPGGTFRTRIYSDYKGGRAATPEEFKGQIGLIQEVLDVLGIAWLTYEDFEADDIVATLAAKAEAAGMRVYLASGDKDSYQLVDNAVTVLYPMPRSEMIEMTPEKVYERTGVFPDRYEDVAALVGEKADNIPGVPGVGPKTAVKWITEYGTLESLLAHAEELKGKAGQSLRDHAEQVKLNRQLNQLIRDLPLGDDLGVFVPVGVDVTAMHDLFDTLDFHAVRSRVLAELPVRPGSEAAPRIENAEEESRPARVLQVMRGSGRDGELPEFCAAHAGPYALAIEGDTRPGRGTIQAFAIAADDGSVFLAHYDPLEGYVPPERHASPESHVSSAYSGKSGHSDDFSRWLADERMHKVGHGVKALHHAVAGIGSELAGVVADTELEAYLLHPDQREYDVADLVRRYLGTEMELPESGPSRDVQGVLALDTTSAAVSGMAGDSTGMVEDSAQMESPAEHLASLALAVLNVHDALATQLSTQPHSERLIALELAVTQVLFEMENRGIAVDQQALERLRTDFEARVSEAVRRAHEAIGDDSVNLASPKQLQKVLFEDLGLPPTKKIKSGYTTNAEALSQLLLAISSREDAQALAGQQFLIALLEHRDAIKLLQSVEGLEKSIHSDGRIRTTYQQAVAATGRLSSTDPNLQNIHARTDEGLQIRGVFVPGEGFDYLMTADYSQIEMRLMAHLSGDTELIEAFRAGADLHRYVAARVFSVPEEEVSSAQRSRIKAMSYGLVYGLSAYGLSSQLHISVPEAQALMDGYFSRFGHVKTYLDGLVDQARRDGYTQTILGRRRYLPELTNTNRQVREAAERMALNAPIQGSAADVIKIAMVHVERALAQAGVRSRVLLQVHDELVLEVLASELEQVREIVEREMGGAWPELSVPLTVGVGIGRSWRDAAH
ncbi:MAG: DNA polymerase I [Actinomycetaceae bacterium]|nr:DNA polymerase I [Actinomycetaceae bacterium]